MQLESAHAELAGLSAQERRILGSVVADELVVVRAEDVQLIHPVSAKAANLLLSRLHKKGWLRRLKRGVYTVVPLGSATAQPAIQDAWLLGMELFAPCYVSGWSAAEHWDLTEQIFNSVSLVTGHPQRCSSQEFGGVQFRTRTIAPDRIFGTTRIWIGSRTADVADRHRLMVDILDAPEFGGGSRHTMDVVAEYWRSGHHDAETLLNYALDYGRGAVLKRLGFSAERAGVVSAAWLERLEANLTQGVVRLDPHGAKDGKIDSRWRLKVNIPLDPT